MHYPFISLTPKLLATTNLFIVSIVLPFPECHRVGIYFFSNTGSNPLSGSQSHRWLWSAVCNTLAPSAPSASKRTTYSAMSMCGALRHKAWVVGKHPKCSRVLPPTRTYQSVKLPTLLTQKKHLFIYSLTLLMH